MPSLNQKQTSCKRTKFLSEGLQSKERGITLFNNYICKNHNTLHRIKAFAG